MLDGLKQRLEDFKDQLEGSPRAKAKLQREATYASYANAAVADGMLTPEELRYLQRVRTTLGVSRQTSDRILKASVIEFFRTRLTSVDYTTADDAVELIQTIRGDIKSLKTSWSEIKKGLRREILAYLGRVLGTQWSDNVMDDQEVATFKNICKKFGVSLGDVSQHFGGRIQSHLENYISEQDAAEELEETDATYVAKLCGIFDLSSSARERLVNDVHRRLALASIRRGNFQSFRSPILLDSSERCVFAAHGAQFLQMGKSHDKMMFGIFVVSDRKMYFVPRDGGQKSLMLKRILSIHPDRGGLRVQGNKKNASGLYLVPDPEFALETLFAAVMIEKRHIRPNEDVERTRHIPQAVKHEVWHRDAGRCRECGATQHLHFDHVIPFSRGGSNTTQNIQLLCVSCNLEKSDRL